MTQALPRLGSDLLLLPAGVFRVTYWFSSLNASSAKQVTLSVSINDGADVLASQRIDGSALDRAGNLTGVSLTFQVNATVNTAEFRGLAIYWPGELSFAGVTLTEISPLPVTTLLLASPQFPDATGIARGVSERTSTG